MVRYGQFVSNNSRPFPDSNGENATKLALYGLYVTYSYNASVSRAASSLPRSGRLCYSTQGNSPSLFVEITLPLFQK